MLKKLFAVLSIVAMLFVASPVMANGPVIEHETLDM